VSQGRGCRARVWTGVRLRSGSMVTVFPPGAAPRRAGRVRVDCLDCCHGGWAATACGRWRWQPSSWRPGLLPRV